MIMIGLDHGNGHVKGISDVTSVNAMSAVARPGVFGSSVAGDKSKKHDVKEYVINDFNGDSYLWGSDIWKADRLSHSFTTEDRYKQKVYQALTKIAVAELANNGEKTVEVSIVTGCPAQETNTSMEAQLESLLKGDHVVTIEDQKMFIEVKEVKVLPQPIGTVMDLYINESGYVEEDDMETDYVGIIDVGSGTTDLDGIKELNRQDDDTATIQLGMNVAYQNIAKYIKQERPNEAGYVTWKNVEYQIRNNEDPSQYSISKRVSIDITEVKKREFERLADDLVAEINQVWPSRSKFDKLILTGGGAEVLAPYFMSWEKDIHVVKDAQFANARGFWKYGKAFIQPEAGVESDG